MNITSNYNLYNYRYPNYAPSKKQSFGSAGDITLKYSLKKHPSSIPARMLKLVQKYVAEGRDDISLRDLHLQTYAGLLKCKTLDEARNMYPEFRDVLPCKGVLKNHTQNIRKIEKIISLDELPLYLLKERWGKLANLEDLIKVFGLKGRYSLGWTMEKLRIPMFPKNYQNLLNASDETRNEIIASKTRAFNAKHRAWVVERNRKLAQDPKNIEMNRELMQGYWDRKGDARADMSSFKAENPYMDFSNFDKAFWDAHPQHKLDMSTIRKELAEIRRQNRKKP